MSISNSNLTEISNTTNHASATAQTKVNTAKVEGVAEAVEQEGKYNAYISRGMKRVIEDQIEVANQMMEMKACKCEYRFIEGINRISITVVDAETEEVIKEIPAENVLEMAQKLQEMAGLQVDERR